MGEKSPFLYLDIATMTPLIIIPTYNERDNIENIISQIHTHVPNIDILIIDDNSPDKTHEIVADIAKQNPHIFLIKRDSKQGLGSAYVTGFNHAILHSYDCIIQMDADLSHDPKEIPVLLEKIIDYDCVIGSRYITSINVINWPLSRLILSWGAAKYVRIITGMPIKDPTGGYKCIRVETLKNINLHKILSDGYSFQIEINYRIWLKKYKMIEIPIIFTDRLHGHSKLSKKIVREAIYMVWKLRFLAIFNKL